MTKLFLTGTAGHIEANCVSSNDPTAPVILLLHPHPLYGGSMNSKIIFNLCKSLFKSGFTVLCINFRGVGKSSGTFDNGVSEVTDSSLALDWLGRNYPNSRGRIVGGFSFGAWIGMQVVMRRPDVGHFISIAPPVNKYDFSFFSPCPVPGLIMQGNIDSVVSEDEVGDYFRNLSINKNVKVEYDVIQGADHFFRDKIDILCNKVKNYLCTSYAIESDETDSSNSENKAMFLD